MGAADTIATWFEKNLKQSIGLVEPHLAPGDELLAITAAMQYGSELLTWLPFIGSLMELRKKRFLLGASRERLILVQIKRVRIEPLDATWYPMREVGEIEYRRHAFTASLAIPVGATVHRFKEVPHDSAERFKDAIDTVQGRPSRFS